MHTRILPYRAHICPFTDSRIHFAAVSYSVKSWLTEYEWALATKCARSIMKSFFIFRFIIFGNSYTVPSDNKPGDTQHVIIRSSVQSCCRHHNHFKHPLPVVLRLLNTNCLKARCWNHTTQHDGVNAALEAKEVANLPAVCYYCYKGAGWCS